MSSRSSRTRASRPRPELMHAQRFCAYRAGARGCVRAARAHARAAVSCMSRGGTSGVRVRAEHMHGQRFGACREGARGCMRAGRAHARAAVSSMSSRSSRMCASMPSSSTSSGCAHAEQELVNVCEHAELKHEQRFRAYREGIRMELGLGLRGVTSRERTSQMTSSRSRKLRSEHHHVHVISSIEINH
jgi:hypothetical protein